jgi:hypothetical protein
LATADIETRPFDVGTLRYAARDDIQMTVSLPSVFVQVEKRGQEPIVRSTLLAIWLLVPDPISQPETIEDWKFVCHTVHRRSDGAGFKEVDINCQRQVCAV